MVKVPKALWLFCSLVFVPQWGSKNSEVRGMRDEVKLIKEYYVYTN